MSNPAQSEIDPDDEISLADIVSFLTEHAKTLIAGAVAALVLAGGYIGVAPERYRATANIQMAAIDGDPIETPAVLVEKLKLPLYFSASTSQVCGTDDVGRPSRTLTKELNPTVNRNAPFVTLTFTGKSPAAATACLEAVFREIEEKQAAMSAPLIKLRQASLQSLKEKQEEAQAFLKMLPKVEGNMAIADTKLPAVSLMITRGLIKESEARELQVEIADAELRLSPPNTQGAKLAAPIYAPDVPVGPAAWMILMVAPIVGLVLTIMLLLLRRAWHGLVPKIA